MRIQRTIPPAAAPLEFKDLAHGLSGIFTGGRSIRKRKEELGKYFGVRHVFPVSSGKAALTIILNALKSLSPGKNEVLIPAYTCFSVPSAIVKAGLRVSLCDIDPATLDFDYKLLEESIHEKTLCVIPTHLFGIPSDVDKVKGICRERGIFVVEDAAQAMGGADKGKMLGTGGDAGFFSFGRGKNITCGSGGIIVTNSDRIAEAIAEHYDDLESPTITEDLREFVKLILMKIFIHPALYWFPSGISSLQLGQTRFYKDFPVKKMSGMKAGVLRDWKVRLEQANQARKKTGAFLREQLQLDKKNRKGDIPCLRLPVLMTCREVRDRVYSFSQAEGLGLSPMYPSPINEIEELKGDLDGRAFPSAKQVSERLLTIPTHHLLSKKDKKRICNRTRHSTMSMQHELIASR